MGIASKVVILGCGFAGIAAARALKRAPIYGHADRSRPTTTCSSRCCTRWRRRLRAVRISAPIRHILRKQKNAEVILGEVTSVDPEKKGSLRRRRAARLSLRLPGDHHRVAPLLFREGRLGAGRPRPQGA